MVKRSAVIAITNMVGNTATIYGSYMYPSSTGPQFVPGGSANAAICVLVAVLALVLRYVHKHENKKLERAEAEFPEGSTSTSVDEDGRVVDRRAVGFRYIY